MASTEDNPFVAANERIVAKARELEYDAPIPLLCECTDLRCRRIVRTPLDAYDTARAPPWQAITVPGHDQPSQH